MYGQATLQTTDKVVSGTVEAGPSYLDETADFSVIAGRMYTQAEVVAHRPVILLSQTLALQMFGKQNPVGQTVTINGTPLQVIGVTASTQVNLLASLLGTDYAYMPYTTCTDLFPWWTITEMDVQVKPGVNTSVLANHLILALNIHDNAPGAFEDSSGFLGGLEKTIGTVTAILTLVIGAIAGIALLVGGIGVMNIMLVSVTEHTQEIGIRMSLGATRRAILVQFLVESAMITLIGGGLGILLGVGAAVAVNLITHLPTEVSWIAVVGSFVFSGVIGVVCGLYPANKAARLNPIDALRYE